MPESLFTVSLVGFLLAIGLATAEESDRASHGSRLLFITVCDVYGWACGFCFVMLSMLFPNKEIFEIFFDGEMAIL